MLLIIETILTVYAWRNGWRGWALIPCAALILIGFTAGAVGTAVGMSPSQVGELATALVPLDLVGIGCLVGMVAKGRNRKAISERSGAESSPLPESV